MNKRPVFIVGLSRSGTTLLANILNRHPRIAIYPETHFFSSVWACRKTPFLKREKDVDEAIGRVGNLKNTGIRAEDIKARFFNTDKSLLRLFDIVLALYREKQGKARPGEKTPGHFLYLPLLLKLYPDAKVLCIYRDPRNTYSSFKHRPEFKKLSPIDRCLIGRSLLWNLCLRRVSEYRRKEHAGWFKAVKFEELITRPQEVAKSICGFLNEPYCQRMLYVKHTNSSFTASQKFGMSKKPLDRTGHLARMEIFFIELICGGYMLEEYNSFLVVSVSLLRFFKKMKLYLLLEGIHISWRKIRMLWGLLREKL